MSATGDRGLVARLRSAAVGRPAWPLLTLVVSIPLIVAVAQRVGQQVVPVGDLAITDLAVRDVSRGHLTLLGPYSRYGWNHPGPAMFVLMAPFQWLSGGAAWGTILGANALKALGLGLSLREGERLGGRVLAVVVAVVLALALAPLGAEFAIDPWNPWIAVVYLPATVLGTASVLSGHRRALLPLVFSASVMTQSHVGFVPIVGVIGLTALALVAVDRTTRRRVLGAGRWTSALIGSAVLGFVFWVGPAWDAAFGRGNVQAMYRYFTSPNAEELVGNRRALGLVAVEFHPVPPWLGGANPKGVIDGTLLPAAIGWAVVAAAFVAAALAVAVVVRRVEIRATALLVVATSVAALASLPRVTMPVRSYLFPYRSMIPLALLAVVACGAWARFGPGSADEPEPVGPDGRATDEPATAVVPAAAVGAMRARFAAGFAVIAIVVPSVATAHTSTTVPVRARNETQVAAAARALEATYRARDDGRPVVVASLGFALHGWDSTLLNELDRVGIPLFVPEDQGFKFSDRRAVTPDEAREEGIRETWWIVEEGDNRARAVASPGVDVVFRSRNLPDAEQAELDRLYLEVGDALVELGDPDLASAVDGPWLADRIRAEVPDWERLLTAEQIERLTELNARAAETGCQCAVVATPVGAPAPA